jgi:DNA-binding transcriptional MerR regulator
MIVGMLRIGELARLVGVSTRAIRHYHAMGVLPEPRRRVNGYREYDSRDLLRLLRLVRLTGLGLTLDEVRDALAQDDDRELREVLGELVAELDAQREELARRRQRIAEVLSRDEDLAASPAVSALIGRLRGVVDDPAVLRREGELLELIETTVSAEQAAAAVSREFSTRFEALTDEGPDHPEVLAVAEWIVRHGGMAFPLTDAQPADPAAPDPVSWELFLETLTPAQQYCVTRAAGQWQS